MTEMEKVYENDKCPVEPPKPTWGLCCYYCKELKLSPDEIEEMQKHYIFNNNPCSGCRSRDISHLI